VRHWLDFNILIQTLEDWTRQGKRRFVMDRLLALNRNDFSISQLASILQIANRNHFYSLTLRYLFRHKQQAEERSEGLPIEVVTTYAAALLGIGAIEEAQRLLKPRLDTPAALFSFALSHFSTWSYSAAEKHFIHYIQIQPDDYMKKVGHINLVAAYIGSGNLVKAERSLHELMKDLKSDSRAAILYANCWELKAQIEIINLDYAKALESLEHSKTLFNNQLSRYLLYVNKWQAVAQLALNPHSSACQQQLLAIKEQGRALKNWETIRDCDFHLARYTSDERLLQQTLLGTPYKGFHLRVKKLYGISIDKKSEYLYMLSSNQNSRLTTFCDLVNPAETLIRHPQCLNLFLLLTRDFYRPPRFGVLHAELHPQEYFNPFTSPHRIRNTILRLNKLNFELNNGLQVRVRSGDVFLETSNQVGITFRRIFRTLSKDEHLLAIICAKTKGSSFCCADAAKFLKISPRSALKIINYGIQKRRLVKLGRGKSSFYQNSNHSKSKAG
jgi:tetratricopeptide (TPR) repeat protein